MSRSLKLLAKENRSSRHRPLPAQPRPRAAHRQEALLSDLRESGCLTADTRILRADTGAEIHW